MKVTILPISAPEYFAAPVLSNSQLKGGVMKASEATLRMGQLVHMAVYEPPLFEACPEARTYLTSRDSAENAKLMRHVLRMSAVALSNPVVAHFTGSKRAKFEQELFCLIQVPGIKQPVPFKMKADALLYSCEQFQECKEAQDLKTTACKTLADFVATFEPYGYWDQAFLYKLITGARKFYFVGVTKGEPHQTFTVNVARYPEEMAAARRRFKNRVKNYLDANPEYLSTAQAFLDNSVL